MNLYNEKIKFMHFRRYTKDFMPKGKDGVTVAYYQEGEKFTFAVTRCGRTHNFNKKEGRKWSVARLKERAYKQVLNFASAREFREFVETSMARQRFTRCPLRGPERSSRFTTVQPEHRCAQSDWTVPTRMERNTDINQTLNCS